MTRPLLDDQLQPVPLPVKRTMLEDAASLEPGAGAVIGRFFAILQSRREPVAAPSAESFRQAAASESTFRTLLRALARYAPDVSTAAAIEVKAEWVSRRPKPRPRRLADGEKV
ncbi:hypothetical protein FIU97_19375 (plasmid) [Roseivivax sp. THAF40]|uniref:hypothetical protein n=1 Tax=unclassified Roseivivax TaxID=2639302 RepID=UPI001268BD7B|nr:MULTISPECIES: hypothetical protein [unclassified Roseivivax]QFS84855.1 hypothetical protein FIV09_18590 [Roseivivax sp. THAF197b]QFT48757.1 hypothetical protein FIU97_19375 [Roseivivax sp. THAF40]